MLEIEGAGASDRGVRERNEDAIRVLPEVGLYVLADGMGGYAGGAVASLVTVETLADFYARNAADGDLTWPFGVEGEVDLARGQAIVGVRLAHAAVRARKRGPLAQMGSTVAALAFHGARAVVAHVGDSRVHRLRGGALEALTRDHSFVEELLLRGDISREDRERIAAQYGHVVTRAIGIGEHADPDVSLHEVRAGDVFVLTSDGVHGVLELAEMSAIIGARAPADAAERLVAGALARGSRDNATAIVVRAA